MDVEPERSPPRWLPQGWIGDSAEHSSGPSLRAGLMDGNPQAGLGSDVSVALVIEDDVLYPDMVRMEMPTPRMPEPVDACSVLD